MFDLGRIVEQFGGLFSGAAANTFSVEGLIGSAGLDLSTLQNLPIDEVLSTLSAAGVDVSALTEGQLGELIAVVQPGGLDQQ